MWIVNSVNAEYPIHLAYEFAELEARRMAPRAESTLDTESSGLLGARANYDWQGVSRLLRRPIKWHFVIDFEYSHTHTQTATRTFKHSLELVAMRQIIRLQNKTMKSKRKHRENR